jgi:hypothetical protein
MTHQEIETALGQRLAGISPAPRIAWPNKDATLALPYLEFRHVPVSIEDDTLDNTGRRQRGIVLITVVAQEDQFTTVANDLAQQVQEQFPRSLRIAVTGKGDILINRHPEPVAPFQDGAHWRQPVRITYETEET